MDSLLEQIQTAALQADAAGRHKVLDFLRSLQLKLESPHDALSRYSGLVCVKSILPEREDRRQAE
jgi:hypothetical protein